MSDRAEGINPKDKQYLDLALDGQSDEFKVKVYEIVRRFRLDATDPAFLLLISTGRLEVLLEEFPDRFEALFRRELTALKQQFTTIQQWMTRTKADLDGYRGGLEATGDRLVGALSYETAELQKMMAEQQQRAVTQVDQVFTLAKAERVTLDTQMAAQLKVAQQEHLAAVKAEAKTLIEVAGRKLQAKYVKELLGYVLVAVMVVLSLGMGVGWTLHQQAMGELDSAGKRQLSASQWAGLQWAVSAEGQLAKHLLDWNDSTISECQNGQGPGGEKLSMVTSDEKRPIKYGNCVLWVVPPDKREFGPKPDE